MTTEAQTLNKFTVGESTLPTYTTTGCPHCLQCPVSNCPITDCGKTAYTLKVHSWQPLAFTAGPHLLSLIDSEQYQKETLLHKFGEGGRLLKKI